MKTIKAWPRFCCGSGLSLQLTNTGRDLALMKTLDSNEDEQLNIPGCSWHTLWHDGRSLLGPKKKSIVNSKVSVNHTRCKYLHVGNGNRNTAISSWQFNIPLTMHLEHLYKDNRLIQNHSLVCMNSLFSAPSDPIYVSGKHGSRACRAPHVCKTRFCRRNKQRYTTRRQYSFLKPLSTQTPATHL